MIIAIDPGNVASDFNVIDEQNNFKPVQFNKVNNFDLLEFFIGFDYSQINHIAIEMISHYGKNICPGKEVFDTCVWIGRFTQVFADVYKSNEVYYIPRPVVKEAICGTRTAKDKNIRRALIDTFAQFDYRTGKGTSKNPDFFYGFKDDNWQSFALGYAFCLINNIGSKKQLITPAGTNHS